MRRIQSSHDGFYGYIRLESINRINYVRNILGEFARSAIPGKFDRANVLENAMMIDYRKLVIDLPVRVTIIYLVHFDWQA